MKTATNAGTFVVLFVAFTSLTIASNAQTMKAYPFTAKGSFSVTTTPEGQTTKEGELTNGKYIVAKTFQGDLQGTSKFEMHTAGADNGSAAYVALEQVTGTLNGKSGTFLLMHNGAMSKTAQQLTITVVPGCGTGELKTLEGKFIITITGKEHFYVFEYSL